jgi:branched-chain amino acid transport system ATP-binding protein
VTATGPQPASTTGPSAFGSETSETADGPVAVRLRGVGRRFGGLHAVRDVDLDVPAGQRRVIIGPNGAGKTTLFNLIAGELPASTGTVWLLGVDATLLPARRRARLGLARTYQRSRLLLGLTVEDNLYLAQLGVRGGHLRPFRSRADAELRARAAELAATVGLAGREQTLVGSLSHGEQRQLEIGMGLAASPKLLLLDEPASGLSRGERAALIDLLEGLDRTLTVLLIEHDMDVALRVGEQVTMMHEGRVVVEGTPDRIRADDTVQRVYLGQHRRRLEEPHHG